MYDNAQLTAPLANNNSDDSNNSTPHELLTATATSMLRRWLQQSNNLNDDEDYRSDNTAHDSQQQQQQQQQDTYEFVAFVLWYLFLVMCCVIPTCCAYRRRRQVEVRLAQQQSRLAQRHFEMHNAAPNMFLLDQLHHHHQHGRRSSERIQSIRTEKLGEELQETTMTLSQADIQNALPSDHVHPERASISSVAAAAAATTTTDCMFATDNEDNGTLVHLPSTGVNANRTVPGICAICLCPYEDGDRVSWSPESACQHAFHTDCIIPWLAKKEEQKCPVCRQEYCPEVVIEDDVLQVEEQARAGELFLDSFALALSYARAQSDRHWTEIAPVRYNHHRVVAVARTASPTTSGGATAATTVNSATNRNQEVAVVVQGGGGAEEAHQTGDEESGAVVVEMVTSSPLPIPADETPAAADVTLENATSETDVEEGIVNPTTTRDTE